MAGGSPFSEDELIARFLAPLAGEGGFGLRDDTALLSLPEGEELVLTVDAVVAGVHFLPDDPPASIARKALRVNLSDLAAKGAAPRGFLLVLALPPGWTEGWMADFAAGLGEDAAAYGCPLLGGDTVRTPGPLTLSITAFGAVPQGTMVPRTGAHEGDAVLVSGTIGDAALGLALHTGKGGAWAAALTEEERGHLVDRYLHPRPRTNLAAAVRANARAAMDVSDGLVGDFAKMLRAARLGGEIDLALLPLSAAARSALGADETLVEAIATGGDDYEILCTVPESGIDGFVEAARSAGTPLTRIGTVGAAGGGLTIRDGAGERQFARGSYGHF
ncbi:MULTISPECIES: thiamine-phosphate kinase [unclassified Chelatococcus]|uniref:thiamine-phosphate kinase n=1 Tax=unclassified Chelatococcus TaxID=2638111 RepID=UPI0003043D6F|nr:MULTISPECIES: thiamine-phosphate kinase [unclassified Chelatococcus]ALA18737.1 thiamine-monophosphate kinase [Chelatococcus sp. CO-6]